MIFWILYALSFLLMWFENRLIVLSAAKRPVIFGTLSFQFILWITRLAFQYGSIIGIWYVNDIAIAILAFAIIYAFGKITFKIYFNKEVQWTASYLTNILKRDADTKGEKISDDEIYRQAYSEAYNLVVQNMKTGGRGF